MPQFKELPIDPSQMMLFGMSVEDALPKDSDVRNFSIVMDCLDYSIVERKRSELGCPSYPPRQMLKVLIYAYSKGIRSSRRIEELLKVDVRFIWLSGGLKPDHNTLARFRKDNFLEMTDLFKDSIRLCMEAGLVHLNVVATDGTKIAAAASRRSIRDSKQLERDLEAVDAILREAEEIDRAEDEQQASSTPKELPEDLKDAKRLKAKLESAARRLKESRRAKVVTSEPDSRLMKTSNGTRPCYNLQASVDAESQVVVAMKLTQHEVDTGELAGMVEQVESNTGCSASVTLADCGYCDEATVRWAFDTAHEILMPLREQYRLKSRNDLFSSKCFLAHPERDVLICPAGRELRFRSVWSDRSTYRQYLASDCQSCSFYRECVKTPYGSRRVNVNVMAQERKLLAEKLASEEGKRLFSLRSQSIETVFGQLKSNRGFSRFLAWGFEGASAEAAIACIAHNVKKCAAKIAANLHLAVACLLAVVMLAPAAQSTRPSCHGRTF